jgi:hypothetical protein
MQYRVLRALMMLFATHAPPCSDTGDSLLKRAIDLNAPDVIAFLRSVGAPEPGLLWVLSRKYSRARVFFFCVVGILSIIYQFFDSFSSFLIFVVGSIVVLVLLFILAFYLFFRGVNFNPRGAR